MKATVRLAHFRNFALPCLLLVTFTAACSSDPDPQGGSGGAAPSTGGSGVGGAAGGSPSGGAGGLGTGGGTGAAPATGGTGSSAGVGGASGGSNTGGAEATGGSGGSVAGPVTPVMNSDSSYVLSFGETIFEVDPTQGSRIVTFSLSGSNLIFPLEVKDFLNGGSTFWLSPQTGWDSDPEEDWPPVVAIDSGPYAVSIAGTVIATESAPGTFGTNMLTVKKDFSADASEEKVHITYGVTNNGPGVASHGPWEVSRHARGGLIVWPGNDTPDASWDFQPDYQDGVYFLDDSLGATGKIFTDGSAGWIAYVTADVVMIKTWADVPAAMIAPNHSEVEVYLDPDNSYIEVEMHGAFAADLQVDASFSWDVDWYIRALPDDLDASSGSAALVAWIESVVH